MSQPPEPYAPAQDPWAGTYVPGVASVPDSAAGQGWSSPAGAKPMGAAARYFLALLAVVVFAGGAGYGSWYFTGEALGPAPTPSGSGEPAPEITQMASCPVTMKNGQFDPCGLKVGDCFINLGTSTDPDLKLTECASTPNRYRIDKVLWGAQIRAGGISNLTQAEGDDLRDQHCTGGVGRSYYAFDYPDYEGGDRFVCMSRA